MLKGDGLAAARLRAAPDPGSPEDDLDNRFVYDDVVTLLRGEGAELVLSLADDDGHCSVRTRASIDDATVREEIGTVLEGGADAFRRRAEKYGGLDDARGASRADPPVGGPAHRLQASR